MEIVVALAQVVSLLVTILFVQYVVTILVPYLRRKRSNTGDADRFAWHMIVPARDEEVVIGTTITRLRGDFPQAHVWIVDDASEDGTARVVEHHATDDPMIHLVSRRLPEARTGKGDALNAAFRLIEASLPADVNPHRVIVGVVDADGHLDPHCLPVLAGPAGFAARKVGGVQVEVRMRNVVDRRPLPHRGRLANYLARNLVRMQDLEFRTVIAAVQHSRHYTGTVGLGGNGQFTRLSALRDIDRGEGRPWRGSLLEDFELGVHLLLAGWSNVFVHDTWVSQEGLFNLRRFLTQRTRWGQGVLQCARYWTQVNLSRHYSVLGVLETSYFLLQPWTTVVLSLLFPLPMVLIVYGVVTNAGVHDWFVHAGIWYLVAYYVVGILPYVIWGPIYRRRCAPEASFLAGIGWGLAYVIYTYGYYITTWRAFLRIVTGRSGWAKTRRNAEVDTEFVAREA